MLCIQGFRGQGYSPAFVINLARIVDRLGSETDTDVRIVTGADDVCHPCPHLSAGKCARAGDDVISADSRVMERLSLGEGDVLAWDSLLERIGNAVQPADLRELCGRCRWLSLNYCAQGVAALGRD